VPAETPECIHALSSTTFVQAVTQPTLAILVPLLMRGLVERSTPVKRRTAIIISNMAKLVPEPWMAAPLLPKLLPGLKKLRDEVADPECRAVATKAFETLFGAADCKDEAEALAKAASMAAAATTEGDKATKAAAADAKAAAGGDAPLPPAVAAQRAALVEALALANLDLSGALAGAAGGGAAAPAAAALIDASLAHGAWAAHALAAAREWSEAEWCAAMAGALAPLVRLSLAADAAALKVGALAVDVLNRAYFAATGKARSAGDGDVGVTDPDADDATIPDLCKCEFSLAYGGKILLNTAKLHMKKGKKYGLIGPNGCGKSTLMKAIANGQLEGFPSKAELRTCYVEHDIQAIQESFSVLQYVLSDPMVAESLKADEPGEVQVIRQLSSLGFTDKMIHGNVTALSGGWKMKCALARALLSNVSLMLLDEPTNHLDVKNAAWLTDYIASLTDVSCMLVSHDTGFLDKVCSHIIHYESFKLRAYKGNLTNFVAKKPEARAYYELSATQFKFSFPEPGFLDGVRSKDKAILKCMKASYTYPGRDTPQIKDASVAISLSSRVVVHGPNGAGKSTLIKCITGEVEPQGGTVWKHPAVRIAYVAQHAFHHIEEHLQSTPMEYLQWRYASGEDREGLAKASRMLSEEQQKKMNQPIMLGGVKLVVQELLARRKSGKSYEVRRRGAARGGEARRGAPPPPPRRAPPRPTARAPPPPFLSLPPLLFSTRWPLSASPRTRTSG
jgi:elongation factor 3